MRAGNRGSIEKRVLLAAFFIGGAMALPWISRALPKWGFVLLALLYGITVVMGLGFIRAWGCLAGLVLAVVFWMTTHSAVLVGIVLFLGWSVETMRAKKSPPQF